MKYLFTLVFCLTSMLALAQGAGIRYVDSIPTDTPDINSYHAVKIYNKADNKFYSYQDSAWIREGSIQDSMTIDSASINKLNVVSLQYEVPSSQVLLAGESIQVNDVINLVVGNSGAVNLTSNPQIAAGVDGQIIHVIGTSDANTITLDDGDGIKLDGGVSAVLGEDDVITFIYRNGNWIEQSRTDN